VELRVCHQDINIQVISDLGIYTGPKFKIGDTEIRSIDVSLNGVVPGNPYFPSGSSDGGVMYFAALSVESATQEQGCFLSNDVCDQPVGYGKVWSYSSQWLGDYLNEKLVETGTMTSQEVLYDGESGMSCLVLRNDASVKTTVHVGVMIYKWKASPSDMDKPFLVVMGGNGTDDSGFEADVPATICGLLADSYFEYNYTNNDFYTSIGMMQNVRLVSSGNVFPVYLDDIHEARWSLHTLWTSTVVIGATGPSEFLFQADMPTKFGMKMLNISFDVLFKDTKQPEWSSFTGSGEKAWGSILTMGADYRDGAEPLTSNAWVDHSIVWNEMESNGSADGSVATSAFGRGHHRLRITAWDDSLNIATLSYNVNFTAVPPFLEVLSPVQGGRTINATVRIAGRVSDDIGLASFTLGLGRTVLDLKGSLSEDGSFLTDVGIGPDPGNYTFVFEATDNVGLVSRAVIDVVLLPPPDVTRPYVEVTDPNELERVYRGDVMTVRGTAEDDDEVVSLKAITPDGVIDLIDDYGGYSWQFKADTSAWPLGDDRITIEASDPSGNRFSFVRTVVILSNEVPVRDVDPPVIAIESPAPGTAIDVSGDVRISGTVTDDSGTASLWVSWDGGGTWTPVDVDRSGGFVCSIPASDLLAGNSRSPSVVADLMEGFTVRFRALDRSENEATLNAPYPLADEDAPVFLYLQAGSERGSDKVLVQMLVNDSSTVEKVLWRLEDGRGGQVTSGVLSYDDLGRENDGFSSSWEVRVEASGEYKLIASAIDPFGNEREGVASASVSMTGADGQGPSYAALAVIALIGFAVIGAAVFIGVRAGRKA
jgi:hypothetical protein